MDVQKVLLRNLVDNVYIAQRTRIAMGNQLVASLRNLGLVDVAKESKTKSDEMSAEDTKVLSVVLDEFALVSQTYAERFSSRGSINKALAEHRADAVYIRTELIYNMVNSFVEMSKVEAGILKTLTKEVKCHKMWDAFFANVKGCGPLMAAVCIAYFDPHKARFPSSFWKYAGLDVITDENGSHGRTRSDTVMVPYKDKNGNDAERKSLGYNPFVKTKLVGVLGTSFLRAGAEAQYAKVYYDYKNRIQNRPDCTSLSAVVIHRRATRYAVKMFLRDMWKVWRELEGLPVGEDYAVAKLRMLPHHDPRNTVSDEDILRKATGIDVG